MVALENSKSRACGTRTPCVGAALLAAPKLFVTLAAFVSALTTLLGLVGPGAAAPTRSTTIALTSDETRVAVVNREANSLSIIQVKDAGGNDVAVKLAEIGVGEEPRCVAVHPTGLAAYVTNAITGTVSVVDLVLRREVTQIPVGTEPRGCALTPDGSCSMWPTIPKAPWLSSSRATRSTRSSMGV